MAKQGLTIPPELLRRIMSVVREVEGQGPDLTAPSRRRRAGAAGGPIRFGLPAAEFTSGTTIELVQADVDGNTLADRDNVTVHLAVDASSITRTFATSDLLRYRDYATADANGVAGVLVGLQGDTAGVPTGAVLPFAGKYDIVPVGYLFANGAEVLRSSALGQKIGTRYGDGNGTTTYNIPDTRNKFWKAAQSDEARDNDTDRGHALHGGAGGGAGNNHDDHPAHLDIQQIVEFIDSPTEGHGWAWIDEPDLTHDEHTQTDNEPPHWIGPGIIKT